MKLPTNLIICIVLPKEISDFIFENGLELNVEDEEILSTIIDLCVNKDNVAANFNQYLTELSENQHYSEDEMKVIEHLTDIVFEKLNDLNVYVEGKLPYTVENKIGNKLMLIRRDLFFRKLNNELN